MEWINIRAASLDSEAFLDAPDAAQATWLRLLRYCAVQENGGRIKGAAAWSASKWLMLARVEQVEILTDSPLWGWDGLDLLLEFYPKEAEEGVQARREAGRRGGTTRARNEASASTASSSALSTPSSTASSSALSTPSSTASSSASTKRKEMEGKERKGKKTPLPPKGGERDVSGIGVRSSDFTPLPNKAGEMESASVEAVEEVESPEPPVVVTRSMSERWRQQCVKDGADYTLSEVFDAWQFFHQGRDPQSGQWRMGRTVLTDWRTALERQITRTRQMAQERGARAAGYGAENKNSPRPPRGGERIADVSQAMASALTAALSVQSLGGGAVPEGGAS